MTGTGLTPGFGPATVGGSSAPVEAWETSVRGSCTLGSYPSPVCQD